MISNLAAIVIQHGELGPGRQLIRRGLELCLELDDIEGVATALNILGDVHRRAGDLEEAEVQLRKALATTTVQGFDLVTSDSQVSLALIADRLGRHDEALDLIADAIQRGRDSEAPLAVAKALVGRGYVLVEQGMPEPAKEALRQGLEEAQRLNLTYLVIEAEAALARAALLSGERDEARELAQRVLASIDRPDLLGAIQPHEIFAACWWVLEECGDPQASAALAAGRSFLDVMTTRIDDDSLRRVVSPDSGQRRPGQDVTRRPRLTSDLLQRSESLGQLVRQFASEIPNGGDRIGQPIRCDPVAHRAQHDAVSASPHRAARPATAPASTSPAPDVPRPVTVPGSRQVRPSAAATHPNETTVTPRSTATACSICPSVPPLPGWRAGQLVAVRSDDHRCPASGAVVERGESRRWRGRPRQRGLRRAPFRERPPGARRRGRGRSGRARSPPRRPWRAAHAATTDHGHRRNWSRALRERRSPSA